MGIGSPTTAGMAYERAAKLVEDRAKDIKVTAVDAKRTAAAIRALPDKGE